MTPQEELAALRRLAELEAKAGGSGPMAQAAQPTARSGAGFTDNTADRWGAGESTIHGLYQGLGDELMAGISAAKESMSGGLPFGKAYDQALTVYRGARDKYREENPGTAAATEIAGGLATGIPMTMGMGSAAEALPVVGRLAAPASNVVGRMAQYGVGGAAPAAVYGFNEGEGGFDERAANAGTSAVIGGATGMAVPAAVGAVGRVVQPVRSKLSDELMKLSRVAQSEGIPLTAAQQTGSQPLRILESVFRNLPLTAGPQGAIDDAQRAAFNSAILKRAGIDADNASPDVLKKGFDRLGSEFNRLGRSNTVTADTRLLDDLARIRDEVTRDLEPDQAKIVLRYIDDMTGSNGGRGVLSPEIARNRVGTTYTSDGLVGVKEVPVFDEAATPRAIPGTEYQKMRSDMTTRARDAGQDQALRSALKKPRNALDEAAERSISPEDAQAWQEARRQYANLKTIEAAMNNRSAGAIEGNIQPGALIGAVSNSAKGQGSSYARGGADDLNALSRIGGAFVRDNVPNSGTAQRLFYQGLLTGGAGVYGGTDDPQSALTYAALSLGGPRAVQMAYNSAPVRNYLANTVLDRIAAEGTRRSLAQLLAQGSGGVAGIQSQRP